MVARLRQIGGEVPILNQFVTGMIFVMALRVGQTVSTVINDFVRG